MTTETTPPASPPTGASAAPSTPGLAGHRAADFEESPQAKIVRLERLLADERRFSVKTTRQLHRVLTREVRQAERRAARAKRRAAEAERRVAEVETRLRRARGRADRAEAELAAVHRSTTWRAGRAVVALPARIRARARR